MLGFFDFFVIFTLVRVVGFRDFLFIIYTGNRIWGFVIRWSWIRSGVGLVRVVFFEFYVYFVRFFVFEEGVFEFCRGMLGVVGILVV